MEFRKTVEKDIPAIMDIIQQAQSYFKANGINQWQNNYPNPEVIREDMGCGYSYVLVHDNRIVATVAISFDGEPTYDNIYEGKWLSHLPYVVIHRMAVDNQYKGLGLSAEIMKRIEEMCKEQNVMSIKVDTHKENRSMGNALRKNGFAYCGIIHLKNGSERIAFEKVLV